MGEPEADPAEPDVPEEAGLLSEQYLHLMMGSMRHTIDAYMEQVNRNEVEGENDTNDQAMLMSESEILEFKERAIDRCAAAILKQE